MMFEDKNGEVWTEEDVDALSAWEIEELGIHVFESGGHSRASARA